MVSQAQVCHTFAIGVVFWISTREGSRLTSVSTIDWEEHKNELSLQDLLRGWGRSTVPSTVPNLWWDPNPWRLQVHTWVSGPQKDRPHASVL